MRPLREMTLLYDAACGLCTRATDWIARQDSLLSLRFIATGSEEARRRFPGLRAGELAVVADTGEAWTGNHAWIVCLWALRDYRDLAVRLSGPLLLPLAREAFAMVSANRAGLSRAFGWESEWDLRERLRRITVPECAAVQK